MAFDDACHARHATVTKFSLKFVADLVEVIVRGKVLVNQIEEPFANFVLTSMLCRELNQVMFLFFGF